MELAEDIIAQAKQETPLLTPILDETFKHLLPTDALHQMPDALYEHHCREIMNRVIDD